MFDNPEWEDGGGDDERFERLIDSANARLTLEGDEPIGLMEESIIGEKCDDAFMSVDQVVEFIRLDRGFRADQGIPSHAM